MVHNGAENPATFNAKYLANPLESDILFALCTGGVHRWFGVVKNEEVRFRRACVRMRLGNGPRRMWRRWRWRRRFDTVAGSKSFAQPESQPEPVTQSEPVAKPQSVADTDTDTDTDTSAFEREYGPDRSAGVGKLHE